LKKHTNRRITGIDKITHPLEHDDIPLGDKKKLAFKGNVCGPMAVEAECDRYWMQTELGRIAKMLQEEETLTPLQLRMGCVWKKIVNPRIVFVCSFFCCGLVTW
jgi:Ca2+-transporting ATPase